MFPPTVLALGLAEAFQVGLRTVTDPINFALIVLGVLLGLIFGVLPGLGGTVAIALLIPLTFGMDPLVAFMILTAAMGGTNFGGSVTAILLNTPGQATNAPTLLDGYPMTLDGRAGEAIGASAAASALGALFGVAILTLSIPLMSAVITLFGPPEVFWLAIWGMSVIAVVVKGSVIAGLISAGIGVILSIHGLNPFTATFRWDYGLLFLQDGVPLIPVIIGLFAITEMFKLMVKGGSITEDTRDISVAGRWTGAWSVVVHKWLFVRGAVVGSIMGIIPGVGGAAATFIAYFQAAQTSPDPDAFGTGDIRGVIAPEASNDAKDATQFLPTLGLGIPGSSAMAIMLGAFVLHGIQPGPLLLANHLDVVTVIILSLLISNFLTSGIGLVSTEYLVKITRVRAEILVPVIFMIAFFGTYALNNNIYWVFFTTLFGLLGYSMWKIDMSPVPLVLGLVLGSIVEKNFFRSRQLSEVGDLIFLGFREVDGQLQFASPLTGLLIAITVFSLLLPWLRPLFRNASDKLFG